MNDIEMMELSIGEWEEISHNHVVSCDSMMEFLEEIIEKSETQATLSTRRIKHTCHHCMKTFTKKFDLQRLFVKLHLSSQNRQERQKRHI